MKYTNKSRKRGALRDLTPSSAHAEASGRGLHRRLRSPLELLRRGAQAGLGEGPDERAAGFEPHFHEFSMRVSGFTGDLRSIAVQLLSNLKRYCSRVPSSPSLDACTGADGQRGHALGPPPQVPEPPRDPGEGKPGPVARGHTQRAADPPAQGPLGCCGELSQSACGVFRKAFWSVGVFRVSPEAKGIQEKASLALSRVAYSGEPRIRLLKARWGVA